MPGERMERPSAIGTRDRPLTGKPAGCGRSVGAGRVARHNMRGRRRTCPPTRGCHRRRAPIQIERVEDGAGARKHVDHLPTGSAKHATCN